MHIGQVLVKIPQSWQVIRCRHGRNSLCTFAVWHIMQVIAVFIFWFSSASCVKSGVAVDELSLSVKTLSSRVESCSTVLLLGGFLLLSLVPSIWSRSRLAVTGTLSDCRDRTAAATSSIGYCNVCIRALAPACGNMTSSSGVLTGEEGSFLGRQAGGRPLASCRAGRCARAAVPDALTTLFSPRPQTPLDDTLVHMAPCVS